MFGLSTADFSLTLRMQLADTPRLLQGEMGLNEVIKRALPKGQIFVANKLGWVSCRFPALQLTGLEQFDRRSLIGAYPLASDTGQSATSEH